MHITGRLLLKETKIVGTFQAWRIPKMNVFQWVATQSLEMFHGESCESTAISKVENNFDMYIDCCWEASDGGKGKISLEPKHLDAEGDGLILMNQDFTLNRRNLERLGMR